MFITTNATIIVNGTDIRIDQYIRSLMEKEDWLYADMVAKFHDLRIVEGPLPPYKDTYLLYVDFSRFTSKYYWLEMDLFARPN